MLAGLGSIFGFWVGDDFLDRFCFVCLPDMILVVGGVSGFDFGGGKVGRDSGFDFGGGRVFGFEWVAELGLAGRWAKELGLVEG
ncbi:hypothetical protein Q3G72_035035 [Acer saccharum]|nr:hypothetical protein Q3G72_035035 [Acer saccharum]